MNSHGSTTTLSIPAEVVFAATSKVAGFGAVVLGSKTSEPPYIPICVPSRPL